MKKVKLEEPTDTLEKSIEKLQTLYLKEGLSQQITTYLKHLSKNPKIPSEFKSQPLLQLFEECCKDFLLNDLEIVFWGLLIEKIIWCEKSQNIKVQLLYSAYASKVNLNLEGDLDLLNSFLDLKYSGFQNGFASWKSKHWEKLFVPLREFNKAFKFYMMIPVKDIIDYNYYVDELLHIAPPAGILEKETKLEFFVKSEDEIEEGKIPELLNLNSVLATFEPTLPVLQDNWKSIDVSKEIEFDESPVRFCVLGERENSCLPHKC
jgi:hypothetical protein